MTPTTDSAPPQPLAESLSCGTQGTVYHAPDAVTYSPGRLSVFLAGSVDPTPGVERWHLEMARRLSHLPVDILDPWRDDWDSTWVQRKTDSRFATQTLWELENQERADVVVVYLHPKSDAPVSLLELGLAARASKATVCCPDGFSRKGNVEIVCERLGVPLVDSFEELVQSVVAKVRA